MKGLFKKLGFRRQDEMEMEITFKALRLAYIYSISALAIWAFYELIMAEVGWPFIILISQNLVYMIARLIYTKRISGGEDEE
ncbi:MAG: hypothetical protein GX044_01445 [Firmicutes bacterium]|nr:hypothetical protein [Bacillota bacterium]